MVMVIFTSCEFLSVLWIPVLLAFGSHLLETLEAFLEKYVFEMNDTRVMCVWESFNLFTCSFLRFRSIWVIFSILESDILENE